MTLASTGPSGFHIRPIVTVLAVVALVAGVYAISQQILTDRQPSASAPTEAVAETAEPYAGPSGLSEAYAAGKLDAGLNPTPSETFAGSEPASEIVVIEGRGSLYDALIEGKYDVEFLPGRPECNTSSALMRRMVQAVSSSKGLGTERSRNGPSLQALQATRRPFQEYIRSSSRRPLRLPEPSGSLNAWGSF